MISYAGAVEHWRADESFRRLARGHAFRGVLLETPPVTQATAACAFEFVLVDSPALTALAPEPRVFAGHFSPFEAVATFPNLGGDAWLVAPAPQGPPGAYTHLAAFARETPTEQQQALWQAVGAAVARCLSPAPLWLSTSGLGVAWLHVRLDERPKYYTYPPYRSRPGR